MNEDIKNLFEYLKEIYQLKTRIVTDYKNFDKEIDLIDFKETYNQLAEIHDFSEDISGTEEYFVLKYINKKKEFPKIPEEIEKYVEKKEDGIEVIEDIEVPSNIQTIITEYNDEYNNVKKINKLIDKYNELYEYFYNVNKRRVDFEEKIEIVLCKGLFIYKQNEDNYSNVIRRHIFEVPLIIDINEKNNTIYLRIDRENKCNIESNFLSAIKGFKIKNQDEILKLKSVIEEDYINNEKINFQELYLDYLNSIAFESEYLKDGVYSDIKESKCYIFNRNNIIVRKKQPTVWLEDLNNIVKSIKEGIYYTENILPELILTKDEKRIKELLFSDEEKTRVLFPLESNEEQYEVVKQTQNSNLILVQGPPGTGKSHTISNLISNYVAEGKKVLVTSEKSKALEVIKEKLPVEIQNLSMAILNERKDDNDLSNSIQIVLDKYKDKEYLNDYIERIKILEKKLDENNKEKVKNHKEIVDILIDNSKDNKEEIEKIVSVKLNSYMLIDIAKYLSENMELDYIKDINNIDNSSFDKEFLLELNPEIKKLKEYKEYIIGREFDLPENIELEKYKNSIENIVKFEKNERIEKYIQDGINEKILSNYNISQLFETIKKVVELEAIYDKMYIIENCKYMPRVNNINKVIKECNNNRKFFEETETILIGNEIEYNFEELFELEKSLNKINEKLSNDGKIGIIEKMQLHKELEIVSKIRINNQEFKVQNINISNMKLILARVQYDIKVNKIKNDLQSITKESKIWNNIDEMEFSRYVQYIIDMLETFVNYDKYIINLKESIQDIFKDNIEVQQFVKEENYKQLYTVISETKEYVDYINTKKYYDSQLEELQRKVVKTYDVFENLIIAIREKNLKKCIKEIDKIEIIYNLDNFYKKLKGKYQNETSNYILFINDYIELGEDNRKIIVKSFDDIQEYYKIKMFLYAQELKNQKFNILIQQKEELKKEEKNIIIKLIEEKSWYNQINNMDNITCRALSQWLSLKKKLGKGTGKRANIIRREMQEQMQHAKDAIPIWIMPVEKVVEQYPFSSKPQFDVVIMDESSQSSITSITALLRGKKVIIVGDDEQISPISIGISAEDIKSLQNKYLKDTCLEVDFDIEKSIYDLVQNICGNKKVVLKEHFRCLPEIIEFSNMNFYGNRINCLKVRGKENTIKEAIKVEYVPEGTVKEIAGKKVNQKEIERIIQILKNIENDDTYNNKTIGIIALQNSPAHLNIIESEVRRNFNNDFIKNRKIKIGTTYDFQGDERDVIILSMIVSTVRENGEKNTIKAFTKKSDERSFNVASSRAKEQVILVYSVRPEELSTECLRYKLITYYTTYNLEKELEKEKLFESNFEKDVYKMFKSKGIELIPQFKVGKYRIDFVVENNDGKKVAIECDGDKYHTLDDYERDIQRQDVLERCGWRFIRIRASSYYYNQEKIIKDIMNRLEELLEKDG